MTSETTSSFCFSSPIADLHHRVNAFSLKQIFRFFEIGSSIESSLGRLIFCFTFDALFSKSNALRSASTLDPALQMTTSIWSFWSIPCWAKLWESISWTPKIIAIWTRYFLLKLTSVEKIHDHHVWIDIFYTIDSLGKHFDSIV